MTTAQDSTIPKHAGGRPKLPEHERRTRQIKIRATIQEDIDIRNAAEAAGLSIGEFIRRRTRGIPVCPPAAKADARLLVELNAIGNNLNQLVRNIHTDRYADHAPQCEHVLAELRRILRKVGDAFDR